MAFEIENGILKKYVEELGVKVAIIPKGVTVIQEKTFLNCSQLINIIIPSGVMKIEKNAFQGCCRLKTVIIPDTVSEIEPGAFAVCESLEVISISNKNNIYYKNNDILFKNNIIIFKIIDLFNWITLFSNNINYLNAT